MAWLEFTIETTPQSIDSAVTALSARGFSDLVIEDQSEFETFLEENRAYWDYIDEGLQKTTTAKPPTGAGGARDDLRRAEALKDGPNLGVLGRCRFRGRGFGDCRFQQRCLQNGGAAEVIAFGHRQRRAIHHVGAIQIDLGRRHRQRGCVRRRQLGD